MHREQWEIMEEFYERLERLARKEEREDKLAAHGDEQLKEDLDNED